LPVSEGHSAGLDNSKQQVINAVGSLAFLAWTPNKIKVELFCGGWWTGVDLMLVYGLATVHSHWYVRMKNWSLCCSWTILSAVELGTAHACNPSYSGGRDQEDHSLKPAQANSLQDPISKIPNIKRTGGVAQGVGSEFKPRYCKKKKKNQNKKTKTKTRHWFDGELHTAPDWENHWT
jgi:hypothetical protein